MQKCSYCGYETDGIIGNEHSEEECQQMQLEKALRRLLERFSLKGLDEWPTMAVKREGAWTVGTVDDETRDAIMWARKVLADKDLGEA